MYAHMQGLKNGTLIAYRGHVDFTKLYKVTWHFAGPGKHFMAVWIEVTETSQPGDLVNNHNRLNTLHSSFDQSSWTMYAQAGHAMMVENYYKGPNNDPYGRAEIWQNWHINVGPSGVYPEEEGWSSGWFGAGPAIPGEVANRCRVHVEGSGYPKRTFDVEVRDWLARGGTVERNATWPALMDFSLLIETTPGFWESMAVSYRLDLRPMVKVGSRNGPGAIVASYEGEATLAPIQLPGSNGVPGYQLSRSVDWATFLNVASSIKDSVNGACQASWTVQSVAGPKLVATYNAGADDEGILMDPLTVTPEVVQDL